MDNNYNQTTHISFNSTGPVVHPFIKVSFVLGILSLVVCVLFFYTPLIFVGFIAGGLAIVFAILSRDSKPQLAKQAKTGLICGVLGPVLSIGILTVLLLSTISLLRSDASYRDEFKEMFTTTFEETGKSIYGDDFDTMLKKTYGEDFDINTFFDQFINE